MNRILAEGVGSYTNILSTTRKHGITAVPKLERSQAYHYFITNITDETPDPRNIERHYAYSLAICILNYHHYRSPIIQFRYMKDFYEELQLDRLHLRYQIGPVHGNLENFNELMTDIYSYEMDLLGTKRLHANNLICRAAYRFSVRY